MKSVGELVGSFHGPGLRLLRNVGQRWLVSF
jgi:hypothetical protein